jgi:hypothetical protein
MSQKKRQFTREFKLQVVRVPSVSQRAFERKVCMVEKSSQSTLNCGNGWSKSSSLPNQKVSDRQWPKGKRFRKPILPKSRI